MTTLPAVSAVELTITERQNEAARLRKEGYAYREIGEILGVSDVTAMNDVNHALQSMQFTLEERAMEVRELVVARNNDALKAIYEKVHLGDLSAIDRLIRLNEQLLGMVGGTLTRHDITSGGKPIAAPIQMIEVMLAHERPIVEGTEKADESL